MYDSIIDMARRIERGAIRVVIVGVAVLVSASCSIFDTASYDGPWYDTYDTGKTALPPAPRKIFLGGETVTEEEAGGFVSWRCNDFVSGGPTLVEIGYFGSPDFEGLGFILYEGGTSGEFTLYRRRGLDHRWDWGPNGNDYAFVVEADGTGLYYDFTSVGKGGTTTASDVFSCYRR